MQIKQPSITSYIRCLVELTPVPDPQGRRHLATIFVAVGQSIAEALPAGDWASVALSGQEISPDDWETTLLYEGNELYIKPQAGIISLLGVGIGLAILAGIVGLVYVGNTYIWPPDSLNLPAERQPENTFNTFGGLSTTRGIGAKIPVVYGRQRVGGQLLQSYVSTYGSQVFSTTGQTIFRDASRFRSRAHFLLGLSEGPIESIDGLLTEINGQPIGNFPDVKQSGRLGTPDQTALAGEFVRDGANTFTVNQEVTEDPGIIVTTTTEIDSYEINIEFRQGLVSFTETGDQDWNTSTFRIRHRVSPSGAWSAFNEHNITSRRTSLVLYVTLFTDLPLDTYDINIQFIGLRDDTALGRGTPTWASLTERRPNTETYPNIALLAVALVAGPEISGDLSNINITTVIEGKTVRDFDAVGFLGGADIYSQNNALCLVDYMTNTRYGLGIADTRFNFPSFNEHKAYCNDIVEGETRHLLDITLLSSGETAVLELTQSSRAALFESEGQFVVRPTRASQPSDPTQHLSWTGCRNLSLRYRRDPDKLNMLEGQIHDQADDAYERRDVQFPDEASLPSPLHRGTIALPGITRASEAQRQLAYELNRRILPTVEFTADFTLGALAFQAHDIFAFSHGLPGWGVSGRMQPGSTTTVIHLDETVTFEAGGVYHIYASHTDDTKEIKTVVNPGASQADVITLTAPLSQIPDPYTSMYAFGESTPVDTAVVEFRCLKMEWTHDHWIRVTAVAHNDSIYTDPVATPLPVVTRLPDPLGPPPPLNTLVLTEAQRIQPSGIALIVVNVSWQMDEFSPGEALYGGAHIYKRDIAITAAGEFSLVVTVGPDVFDFDDPIVVRGVTYEYRVIPISLVSIPNNLGAVFATILVEGAGADSFIPDNVQNLRVLGELVTVTTFEGRDVAIEWDALTSVLFTSTFFLREYQIDIYTPGQAELLRSTAVTGTQFEYTHALNIEDSAKEGLSGPQRALLFHVRGRTNDNRVSAVDAIKTVTNAAPTMTSILPGATELFEAALIDFRQYAEDRDHSHYTVLLDTVTPPLVVYQDVPVAFQQLALNGLPIDILHYCQIIPHDAFGPGVGSQIVSFTPRSITSFQIEDNSILTQHLAALGVTREKLALLAVDGPQLEIGAVVAGKIAALSVGPGEITANSLTFAQIALGGIIGNRLAASTITQLELGVGSVITSTIGEGAVGTGKIAAFSVSAAEMVPNTLTSAQIASNAIFGSRIAANTITASKIQPLTINFSELAVNAVIAEKIGPGAVIEGKIAAFSVSAIQLVSETLTSAQIASNSIVGSRITANTITASKIQANTITASEIFALTITASELAAGSVIAGKIAAVSVGADEIIANSITAGQIAANTITSLEIAANTITSLEIAANTITSLEIAANTITSLEIAANTITSSQIVANTITAGQIAAGTITSFEIAANTITSLQIAAGTITASEILSNTLTATEIAVNAITTQELAANSVTANKILAGAVIAGKVAAFSIGAIELIADSINASHLVTNVAVITTAAQIQTALIDTAHIANLAVETAQIGDLQVDTIKVANGAVSTQVIAETGFKLNVGSQEAEGIFLDIALTADLGEVVLIGKTWWAGASGQDGHIRIREDTISGTLLDSSVVQYTHNVAGGILLSVPMNAQAIYTPDTTETKRFHLTVQASGADTEDFHSLSLIAMWFKK